MVILESIFGTEEKKCFNCRHYSTFLGCSKDKRKGIVLETNICPLYENLHDYKEHLKKEQKNADKRKHLAEENQRLSDEVQRLKQNAPYSNRTETLFNSKSNISFANDDNFESLLFKNESLSENIDCDSLLLDETYDDLVELEKELNLQRIKAIKELERNYISVIDQLSPYRDMDLAFKIVKFQDLDSFMESIKTIITESKELSGTKKYDSLRTELKQKTEEFSLGYENEIELHLSKRNYNVAYALAKPYALSGLRNSKQLLKTCKEKYLKYCKETADIFVAKKEYNQAIDFLTQAGDEPEIKQQLASVTKVAEDSIISDSLTLYKSRRKNDSIRLLQSFKTKKTESLIKKIHSNSRKNIILVIGLLFLVLFIVFLILGITSTIKLAESMQSDVSFEEFSKIQDQYSPLQAIGYTLGFMELIPGIALTIVGSIRYKIK